MKENLLLLKEHKIYKYITLISKNGKIDKLDNLIKKNNTYHRSIKKAY